MQEILNERGAVLIEVMTDPLEVLGPKASSRQLEDGSIVSAPLEDLAPFLDRQELNELMSISKKKEF